VEARGAYVARSPMTRQTLGHAQTGCPSAAPWWDANKIGLCNPPIEYCKLAGVIYHHGVRSLVGCIYRLGPRLLIESPISVCILGDEWVLGLEQDYELIGDVGNVVFLRPQPFADGDTLVTLIRRSR